MTNADQTGSDEGKLMEQKLAGRVAFITGAASGIGRAIAIEFAASGARVIVVTASLA